ncbi:NADPH-dependent F420 reductase [Sphingomonas hankyongi]|uniref:NAD(P)-binding domain-containing protein n=1 Tax=Sphingomonas hankyongi TaxID=2908209 RepID=A0ABT0S0V6_9SPHN|nr:NAD(P)-binding domain-containing protein [Sphingomonas hankyongi]MCL6729261.1 NAD(P)-binding domain-containing protein [Sphingomonas hankyongi]
MENKISPDPELGVLGTGRMGVRLAAMFARAGRNVVLGSRDADRSEAIAEQLAIPTLRGSCNADALRAPAIIPAVFLRDGLLDLLNRHCTKLRGKLLIDISNPFNEDYSDFTTPWDTSAAEQIQQHFPQANVVGAFKNVFWEVFDQPQFGESLSDVLVTGDDDQAKQRFLALADGTPFRYLDAGPLVNSRTVERLTFITSALGRQLNSYPRMNWRLLTQPQQEAVAG